MSEKNRECSAAAKSMRLTDERGSDYNINDTKRANMNPAKEVYKLAIRNCFKRYEVSNHYYVSKTILQKN